MKIRNKEVTVNKLFRYLFRRFDKFSFQIKDRSIRLLFKPETLPGFIIIGAQKSGTTALHYYLSQHPTLQSSNKKEVRFFLGNLYYNGINYYQKEFPAKIRQKLYFESTPEYLSAPEVPKRIHSFNPQIKLIIILRNPIKRAYSAWNMFKEFHESETKSSLINLVNEISENKKDIDQYISLLTSPEYPSFEEWVKNELRKLENNETLAPKFVRRGIYHDQIEKYYQFFNKEQILIIEDQELRFDRQKTLDLVTDFINVSRFNFHELELNENNIRNYQEPISEETKNLLVNFYKPYNEKLFQLIGKKYDW